MSHGIISRNDSNKITDIDALQLAAEQLGMKFTKCEKGKGHFRTWKDDHGGWVGDWDLPEGVTGEEMGDNADYVLSIPGDKKAYELGIVWNEQDQCWYPAHDFYAGGMGLEKVIGPTTVQGKQVIGSAPKLMEYYRMMELYLQNQRLGKTVAFAKQQEKLVLYIQ